MAAVCAKQPDRLALGRLPKLVNCKHFGIVVVINDTKIDVKNVRHDLRHNIGNLGVPDTGTLIGVQRRQESLFVLGKVRKVRFRVTLDCIHCCGANRSVKRFVIVDRDRQGAVEAVAITRNDTDVLLALVQEIKEGIGHCKYQEMEGMKAAHQPH
jgi:hypothetical protein